MSPRKQLIEEINQAPDFLLEEVLSFFLFVKLRLSERRNGTQTAIAPPSNKVPTFLRKAREINQELTSNPAQSLPTDFAKNLDHYLYGAPKLDA